MTFHARRRHTSVAGRFFAPTAWRHGFGAVALSTGLGGCLLAAPANAQSEDCAELAAAEQALCRLMLACAAIDDADRRAECFQVAARTVGEASVAAAPESSSAPEQAASAANDPPPAVAETVASTASAAPPAMQSAATSAPPEQRKKRRWRDRIASVLRRGDRAAVGKVVETRTPRTTFEIPKRFTATVTAIHRSGRNRRLVALDGKLLFESNRAGEGGLRLGDEVRVVRASRLYGKRFQITGPSRRPFTADRIRCEREDITIATRRQCSLLDD